MKQIFLLLILAACISTATAQMPNAINYQAVARNAQGQALASQTIKVRLSIISSASGNPTLYSETRSVTTNSLGLFNVQIGSPGALSTTGNFSNINWVNNLSATKSLKIELDINNTGAFTDMGSQSLVTVPYAFAADQAVSALRINGNPVNETAPNYGDVLKWNGSAWEPEDPIKIITIRQSLLGISMPGSTLAFAFLGTPTQVTLKAGQTVTVMLTATLGATTTVNVLGVSPVFQNTAGGSVISFYSTDYNHIDNVIGRTHTPVSGTLKVVASGGDIFNGTINEGTYKIGFGIRNISPQPLNKNESLNGTIMIQ